MDKHGVTKILYTHYMKDVSSRAVMHEMSSHSENMKFNVFVNEVLRILRNCSPYTVWREEAARHVTYFMRRMQYSGFPEDMRFCVLSAALRKYDQKVSSGSVINPRQEAKSRVEKLEWYKADGKYDSVMGVYGEMPRRGRPPPVPPSISGKLEVLHYACLSAVAKRSHGFEVSTTSIPVYREKGERRPQHRTRTLGQLR